MDWQQHYNAPCASCLSWLEQHPNVSGVEGTQRKAATFGALLEWEKKHGLPLPEDLHAYYSLSDGLEVRWSTLGHGCEVVPLGCLSISSVDQLRPVETASLRNQLGELPAGLPAGPGAAGHRAFDLDPACASGRVLLFAGLYSGAGKPRTRCEVWFQDCSGGVTRLGSSFFEYYTLLLTNLGLPRWHYAFTDAGLDPVARQWFRLIAPERLQRLQAEAAARASARQSAATQASSSAAASSASASAAAREAASVASETASQALALLQTMTVRVGPSGSSRHQYIAGSPRVAASALGSGSYSQRSSEQSSRGTSRASSSSSSPRASGSRARRKRGSAAQRRSNVDE